MDAVASTWLCLAIEFPFVVFHSCTLICIVYCIWRKEHYFNSTFFLLFCMQSVAALANYLSSMLTMRFARIGYVPKWMLDYPVGNLLVFFSRYCIYFQFVAHLIIAVNRYRVIAHPFESRARPGIRKVAYAALFLAPLPGAATRLFGKVIAKPTENPNIFVMSYDQEWITLAGSTAFTLYSVSTAVVCIGLELRTFIIYHRLDVPTKRSKRDDYGLLICALTQFVAQFLQAGYQIMQAVTALAGLAEMRKQTQVVFPYVNDFLCLSGSICLVLTSSMFRRRLHRFLGGRLHNSRIADTVDIST